MLGFRDLAEHLIAEHPEHVNAEGGGEVTPLHVAASERHLDTLLLLIEHGADFNGRNIYSGTPLHRASQDDEVCRRVVFSVDSTIYLQY
jgi:ankyrin repeat protein